MKIAKFLTIVGQILTIVFLIGDPLSAQKEISVTFGVTGVALKEDMATLYAWKSYLERSTGLAIHLKITRSYEEMQALIKSGNVDMAYVCGATFVELSKTNNAKLLVIPKIREKNEYYSYIIAQKRSPYRTLNDFEGKFFAFSDTGSNSGAIAPMYALIKSGHNPRSFFKEIIYTYDHGESIHAVLDRFVEGAAVDSMVFESFERTHPREASKLRVVQKFGPYPTPPLIVRQNFPSSLTKKLQDSLIAMDHDIQGKHVLSSLSIDYFSLPNDISYKAIAIMIDAIKRNQQ